MKRLKISRGGQVSVPAAVRHRWRTSTVVAEDRGDELVLRPAADDPVAAAEGVFKGRSRKLVEQIRRELREEEAKVERRKVDRLSQSR